MISGNNELMLGMIRVAKAGKDLACRVKDR